MKFIKRTLLIFLILFVVGTLFRGCIYRQLITYKTIEPRQDYPIPNEKLVAYIELNSEDKKELSVKEIIKLSLSITSKQLNFTASKNENDPNKLIFTKTAHCVGYAAFFATSCNHLLRKYDFDEIWIAQPHIGKLYLLGVDIHKYFNSPFFKDHDFVIIKNKKTGATFAVDPTLYDYFYIDFITCKK